MPTLTINGRQVEARDGATLLDTALEAGIYIPHLCHGPGLEPYGACRMCIVEIDGMRGLPAACTTTVADGMQVRTDTEQLNRVRRMICEMLIADHPADCLSCTSNQKCELQQVAAHLGVTQQRIRKTDRNPPRDESNPFFVRDPAKCILCGRCVRVCHEVRGVDAIDIAGRGYESRIATFADMPMRESVCESCGACVEQCPVGALAPKHEILPPTDSVKTICPYCGCGCGLILGTRGGRLVSVSGDLDHLVNKGQLCAKGRFGLDFVHAKDRLAKPLIKQDGRFRETDWGQALEFAAKRLREIKAAHGPDAIAGLSSAKCTNEENYLFQKFMRAAVGTNNVDHCARL